MQVHVYERMVLGVTILVLVIAMAALGGSVVFGHIHLPSPVQRIDPRFVREIPPFNSPGVREVGPGQYEAAMLAQAWAFVPAEIQVPRGATVKFRVASVDVTHGFLIENTNVNITLIPGQVSEAMATFRQPGTYLVICHEYCGTGHHGMFARVVVQ